MNISPEYSNPMNDIIAQLRQDLAHLTLMQQAEATGVTKSTLSRIWNGDIPPKLETVEKIARAAGKTLVLAKK